MVKSVRIYSDTNIIRCKENLKSIHWKRVSKTENADKAFNEFIKVISENAARSFPITKLSNKQRKDKCWITRGIKLSIRHKNRLYCKWLQRPTENNKATYTRYKKKLESVIQESQKQHYESLMSTTKTGIKQFWNIFSNLIKPQKSKRREHKIGKIKDEKGETITDEVSIANYLNNYFTTIATKLTKNLPQTRNLAEQVTTVNKSIYLAPTFAGEVEKLITSLKPKMLNGEDGIPAKIIKSCKQEVSGILADLFNNITRDIPIST